LKQGTFEDYRWALTHHLLPFFAKNRVSQITKQEVDRYKTTKIRERETCEREREQARNRGELLPVRGLGNNQINKTITRLAQILEAAVDYDLLPANPATGRRRRLKPTRPVRTWVEPEQLPALLDAAGGEAPLLSGRGRPLLATLAGAGLRIDEALSLLRREVSIPKGILTITDSKTAAGVRVVDLTPALRDEIALWLDRSRFKRPDDLVFPTLKGKKDNRQNVRRRLLHAAIKRANLQLTDLGIEPIGNVSPHGLRRTHASLRCAVGDDVAFTATQLGHEDAGFTLRVYTHAVKRLERLAGPERKEFERAVEWAQWALMGTSADSAPVLDGIEASREQENSPVSSEFS
jgi:integrase